MPVIEQPNLNIVETAAPLVDAGANHNSSDLTHGCLVAHDEAIVDTASTMAQAVKRANGMAVPASANAHRLWGILDCYNKRSTPQNCAGNVITGGLCKARVTVPASTAVAEGTELVPRTAWDATNDLPLYYADLAPVVYNAAVLPRVTHPFAILREAIASGSARTVTVLVEVVPNRRPLNFTLDYTFPGTNVAKVDQMLDVFTCPGEISGIFAQNLTAGSGANGTVNGHIIPHLAAGGEKHALLSAAISLAHDAEEGVIYGANVGIGGATVATAGTGPVHGTLAALAQRQFTVPSHLAITTTIATSPADLRVVFKGRYY